MLVASVTFVLALSTDWYFHDLNRLAQIVLAVLTAIAMGRTTGRHTVLAWLLVGGMLALALRAGRWGVIEALHVLMLVFCVRSWAARLQAAPEAHLCAFLVGPAAAYLCLVLFPRWLALATAGLSFNPGAFFVGFENPRFFGHWVTLTLPLMVFMAQKAARHDRIHVWGCWMLVAAWTAFLIASGTRGSWLSLGIVAMLLPLAGVSGLKLARGMLLALVLGIFTYGILFLLIPLSAQGDVRALGADRLPEIAQLSRRELLWSLALDGIVSSPLLGAGPMMFSALSNPVGAHPHNLFLQIAYEWGVPCALALGACVVRAGVIQLAECRREGDGPRAALLACIAGGLMQAQVDGILVMPFSQTLFAVLCAWLIALGRRAVPSASIGLSERVVLATCAIMLFLACLPELRELEHWEQRGLERSGINLYLPRFWAQGVIPAAPQPLFSYQ